MLNKQTAHLLLVDDEPANLKLLQKILAREGYVSCEVIQDSRQVMKSYQRQRPDVILLDLNMPHLDGFQVLEQLQTLDDPLLPPVLILTAQQERDCLLKALKLGARDYLSKPFDQHELLMRVANLIEVHQAHCLLRDQKAFLEEEVRKRTCELERTRLEVVRRLGQAAEFRDNETGDHILRMSRYSAILAASLGWSKDECELLLNASPMHDIGKIGIPDAILQKPGKLTAAEYSVMKEHARLGANLLKGVEAPLFKMAQDIALGHHEKWNGEGYPQGLAGEAIPQAARIAAVADVFDALTSARPYKQAWSIKSAVDLIVSESGQHFDPEVVEHFQKCLPQLLAIRQEYTQEEQGQPQPA
ncbi:HD domain-containing phosphohydrolase [Marinospirillum perlucidum]|uniref:HD domain-containing phosphohydrolase n=1 Tax=Marinospirillum perlucidum TaxID=1982602 RepID=UPI000DF17505|nr:HD domain-containing phosphohydrolase [Marinospirillum perlucidum]